MIAAIFLVACSKEKLNEQPMNETPDVLMKSGWLHLAMVLNQLALPCLSLQALNTMKIPLLP